jgi:hypothetical protein
MRKTILLSGIFFFVYVYSFAQGNLRGRLYDSVGKHPMSLATVTIFKAKDTSIVSYRLSDPDGNFKIPGLPVNLPLRAVITSSGYKVIRKEFTLDNNQQLDWGTLNMITDTVELDAALVFAERPPVSVKKDTIEFNASAFKTLPTALVEDLLKKFPGVEVDQDGNMRVNGRAVNRILVDGKDFFGGDPKVATRNLPANLIDKVQVVDDKEQLDRNPDINKADLGQVINLKLKRSIKQGWFGKAYGGGGSGAQTHYETGAIINSFRDTVQVSALGYSNNINRAGFGFGDLQSLGGFNRSGFNSIGIWSDGGIAIDGISLGGTGQGIQRSTGAGININHDPSKKLKINFQYFYGHINSNFESISKTTQTINDTILQTNVNVKDINDDYSHRFGVRLTWKPDSLTTVLYRPSFYIRKYNSNRDFSSEASSNFDNLLNESDNKQAVVRNSTNYSHEFSYSRNFRKRGRSLFIFTNVDAGNLVGDQTNTVESVFYNGQASAEGLNQLRHNDVKNLTLNGSLTYNEPLNKVFSLRFANTTNYSRQEDGLGTFDWDPTMNKYQLLIDTLSNGLDRDNLRNTAVLSLVSKWKKLTVTAGAQAVNIQIDNIFAKGPAVYQQYFYVLPNVNITYDAFNAGYRIGVREPSATDIRPFVDNSNPLYQNYGNPNLQPVIEHNLNARYFKADPKKQLSYQVFTNITVEDDAIIRARTVSDKGVQITRPINVDGRWYTGLNGSVSKQIKTVQGIQFSIRPAMNINYSKNFVIVNNNRSGFKTFGISPSMNGSINWKDKIEFTQQYNVNIREVSYQTNNFTDTRIVTHSSTSEVVLRVPKNWVWESSLDYRYNPQVSPGIRKSVLRWNAGINYLFLKDQKGQLKFYVFDLLKQNTNAFRSVSENFIQDTETRTLTRYFMITFTYNIRDFKGGKVGGRQSMFFF